MKVSSNPASNCFDETNQGYPTEVEARAKTAQKEYRDRVCFQLKLTTLFIVIRTTTRKRAT